MEIEGAATLWVAAPSHYNNRNFMRTIKLTLEYDGTDFHGWQIQEKSKRTVQGEIYKAFQKIFGKKPCLVGSGRTDSGVHAQGQVAHFKTDSSLSAEKIVSALNANLPHDISIIDAKVVRKNFHAQFDVKSKIYSYTILNRKSRPAIHRNFCYFYPYPLNLKLMKTEARALVGQHDFRSFQASDPQRQKQSTVRTIKKIVINEDGGFITIDIEANGFLYKMVRNIVGTLLEIGSGKLPKGSMRKILARKNRLAAGKTAVAKGLRLKEVRY
ncbi:MAG TPA: tRNA pseudouridine(38-40) synthase TruA [Candidatus Omnitrophota bacterium]|nr:tRNA pseudouridine(38-40) synthase TruA [Candidatus Omnitrophota bacterium]HPD85350.1 tRNA pseudouridine(38-40) synthase TruA [Candidatus Omnitrophota bacterium]HRZ04149.1 tRNA pseudouridine(38-40) synthase TruA [Candidatus Omnitrophota bacterium]